MSKQVLYSVIGVWLTVVAIAAGLALLSGSHGTLGNSLLTVFVALVPPAIVFRLFGQKEPQTVAAMLRQ